MRFEAQSLRHIKRQSHLRAIKRYYTKALPQEAAKVKSNKTRESLDLEKILHSDSSHSNSPRWSTTKHLGKGSYGEVVLWQCNMGTERVRSSFIVYICCNPPYDRVTDKN